jgi:pyrimidine nucleoside transport protein
MSAPAALAYAKLFYPETKRSKTTSDNIDIGKSECANLLDAASQGAMTAVFLVANIAGSLIAVVAFIAFINGILSWFGGLIGLVGDVELSIELIFGYLFIPLAWLMGVEYEDCFEVGKLIGIKSLVNEFVAYAKLKELTDGDMISDRSKTISTYALCGFSNPASVGIQISAFSTLAPSRRQDFARIAFRAYVAGSMACFLTACVAGSLIA